MAVQSNVNDVKSLKNLEQSILTSLQNLKQYMQGSLSNNMLKTMSPQERDDKLKEIKKIALDLQGGIMLLNIYKSQINPSSAKDSTEAQQLSQMGTALDKSIQDMTSETNQLISNIQNTFQKIQTLENELNSTSDDLVLKMERQRQQERDIQNKRKLLSSRERMLQLSIEKNVYKRKVIYTYIAIVCLILLLLFSAYFYYSKKGSMGSRPN